ncbi:hypothetical protein WA588_003508 [Blastocystis sp. NMH]
MQSVIVCDNCNNKSISLLENTKFWLAPCEHCFCEKCVSRYINDAFDFKCPKCGIHIRKQQLMEETKEVYEMKRIKDARKEVYTSFNSSAFDTYDKKAIDGSLQREKLFVMKLTGKKDQYREEFARFKQLHEKEIAENEARRTAYESDLRNKIYDEKLQREKKREEYNNRKAGKIGIKMDEVKKRKEVFYSAANCPRIRPHIFEEAVHKGGNPSGLYSIFAAYILRRGVDELLLLL